MRSLPKTVIIVDDNQPRSIKLTVMVNRFGYNVFVARSGPEFERLVNGIIPHIVMLSLKMPAVGGKSYLDKLRQKSLFDVVNVIMYSEADDKTELISKLKSGAEAYLTVPVSPTDLYGTLERLTENRPRMRPRLMIIFKVEVDDGKIRGLAHATSLSESGLFIRTLKPFPAGTHLKLKLDLPIQKGIEVEGEVAYVSRPSKEHPVEPGMGIRFVKYSNDGNQILKDFIDKQLQVFIAGNSYE
ncbi:MAG: response regulator [Deltaproteobacteria bacterium]|nr:response regulator [Deltaproteobacteria bacterium]